MAIAGLHDCVRRDALRRPRITPQLVTLGLVAGCLLSGCAVPHRVGVTKTGKPRYERIVLDYQVDRARGGLIARSLKPSQTVQASATDASSSIDPLWSYARLRVEYPHPDGDRNLAEVTLRLSTHSHAVYDSSNHSSDLPTDIRRPWQALKGSTADEDCPWSSELCADDEIWQLDLPKRELDLLLVDLADSGYFDDQTRPKGAAWVDVAIDRGRTAKAWTPEPRLDELMSRVYSNGYLEGFITTAEPDVKDSGWSL